MLLSIINYYDYYFFQLSLLLQCFGEMHLGHQEAWSSKPARRVGLDRRFREKSA